MISHYLFYGLIAFIAFIFIYMLLRSVRYVNNSRIAVVEKLWGGGALKGGIIALNGEAGFQPDILRGGVHLFFPFQYALHVQPLVTIPQGEIGYVFARDGAPLDATQTLASNKTTADFLDVKAFLSNGGQKGPQRAILREGTYAINTAMFIILTKSMVYGVNMEESDKKLFADMQRLLAERSGFEAIVIQSSDDRIGVVTIHDGPALPSGQIIAPEVGADQSNVATFHNSFQDPEKFLAAGGQRGRQLEVLMEGSYFINRLFATVDLVNKTIIDVGYAGVVISYVGEEGLDTTDTEYRHGELVAKGHRGVWAEPLLPGKYALNTFAYKIVQIPTTNFILKWERSLVGSHKLDENLSEVTLITKDAFEPTLPLSVVAHIDYRKAPMVVQRFGDIKKLVEQTLDPMVSAYFKNVAQQKTLIELLQERSDIQDSSGAEMRERFSKYSLELQEVLIGTPRASAGDASIETVLEQLRARQVAKEKVETFASQKIAAASERELNEAQAVAREQSALTSSNIAIQVASNQGKAEAGRAIQEAEKTRTQATAEADRIKTLGEAEASKIKLIASAEAEQIEKKGLALASTIKAQSEASGGADKQLVRSIVERVAQAIETSGVDIVPRIQVGSDSSSGGGSILPLLTALLSKELGKEEPRPVVEAE